ncbi:hypothetical protein pdam_00019091, partial [Pocillopora damicornis]
CCFYVFARIRAEGGNCQELVRRKTIEASSIEFIGYRRLRAKWLHNLIHKISINKNVSGFFGILIGCVDIGN